MSKGHFRLIVLFLVTFSGTISKLNAFSLNNNFNSYKKHASFSAVTKKHSQEYQLISNNSIPVQLINFQRHKTGHFIHGINKRSGESASFTKYLNIACKGYSSGLSLFRKLILFPFHVFW
jgi:hypothetical protein